MGRREDYRLAGFDTIGTEDSFDLCPRQRTILDLEPEAVRCEDFLFSLDQVVPVHLPATWQQEAPPRQQDFPLPHVHREEHPTLTPCPEDDELSLWNAAGERDLQLKSLENKLELISLHRSVSALKCEMFLDYLEEQQAGPQAPAEPLQRERSGRERSGSFASTELEKLRGRRRHMQQRFQGQAEKGRDEGGGSGGSEVEPAYGQVVTPPHAFMWQGFLPSNGCDEKTPFRHSYAIVRRTSSFKSLPFVGSPGHPVNGSQVSTVLSQMRSGEGGHSAVTATCATVPGGIAKPNWTGKGAKGEAAAAGQGTLGLPSGAGSCRPQSPADPLQEMCVPYSLMGIASLQQPPTPGTLALARDDSCTATFTGAASSTHRVFMEALLQSSSTSDCAPAAAKRSIQGNSKRYSLNQQVMDIACSPPSSDLDSCTSEESPISYQGTVAHRRSSFAGSSLQKQSSCKSPMVEVSVAARGRASFDGSRSERYMVSRGSRGGASPAWTGLESPGQSPFLGNDLSYYHEAAVKRRVASSSVHGRRSSRGLPSHSKPRANNQGLQMARSASGRGYPATRKSDFTQTLQSQVASPRTGRVFGAPSMFSAAPESFSSDQVFPGETVRMETPTGPRLVLQGHETSLKSGPQPLNQRNPLNIGPQLSGGNPLAREHEAHLLVVDCDKDNSMPMLEGEGIPLHMKAGDSRVDSRYYHRSTGFKSEQHVPMF